MGQVNTQRYVVYLRFPLDKNDLEGAKFWVDQIAGAVIVKHEGKLLWIDCPIYSEAELLQAFDSDCYAISPLRTYKLLSDAASQGAEERKS